MCLYLFMSSLKVYTLNKSEVHNQIHCFHTSPQRSTKQDWLSDQINKHTSRGIVITFIPSFMALFQSFQMQLAC